MLDKILSLAGGKGSLIGIISVALVFLVQCANVELKNRKVEKTKQKLSELEIELGGCNVHLSEHRELLVLSNNVAQELKATIEKQNLHIADMQIKALNLHERHKESERKRIELARKNRESIQLNHKGGADDLNKYFESIK